MPHHWLKDPKKLRAALKAVAGDAGIVLKSPAEAEKGSGGRG
jgi:hypothetical protein